MSIVFHLRSRSRVTMLMWFRKGLWRSQSQHPTIMYIYVYLNIYFYVPAPGLWSIHINTALACAFMCLYNLYYKSEIHNVIYIYICNITAQCLSSSSTSNPRRTRGCRRGSCNPGAAAWRSAPHGDNMRQYDNTYDNMRQHCARWQYIRLHTTTTLTTTRIDIILATDGT